MEAKDILAFKNPGEVISQLINEIPVSKHKAVTSILSMIAHNLIKKTPAFKNYDKTHANLASHIFSIVCSRPDASEDDYVNGTVCCEWANNPKQGVVIAEDGLLRFSKSKQLINNAISVNNLTGNHKRSEELLKIVESLQEQPDENYILNASYNLVQSNKMKEANELLENYLEKGGNRSPNVFLNLMYTWSHYKYPDDLKLKQYIEELCRLVKENKAFRADNFVENLLIAMSSKDYKTETIEIADFLLKTNGTLSPSSWVNYTFAAYFLDREIQQKVVKIVENQIKMDEEHIGDNPLTFANMASIYVKLEDKRNAIKQLQLSKDYDHPQFLTFKTHTDYQPIWNDPEFLELFK